MKKGLFVMNVVVGIVLFIGIFTLQAMGAETNLKIANLKLDKSRYMPGDSVKLTYWLKAEGRLRMCFNMGITTNPQIESPKRNSGTISSIPRM
jgi:hypothetical protein